MPEQMKDQWLQIYIKKHHLESILSSEVMKDLELVRYQKGEHILKADEDVEHLYFLVSGRLKLYQIHENGRALLIQFYDRFDSLGEVELMTGVRGTCSVAAVVESHLIRIHFSKLQKIIDHYQPFLKYLVKTLSNKLILSERHHSYNLIYPVKNRLASYLKAYKLPSGEIALYNSFQEISEFIGSTYRQLHRSFQALEKEGVIIKRGKTIEVRDEAKLEALAGDIYEVKA